MDSEYTFEAVKIGFKIKRPDNTTVRWVRSEEIAICVTHNLNLERKTQADEIETQKHIIQNCRETFDTIRAVLDRDCATSDNLGDCVVRKVEKQAAEIERLKKALMKYEVQELNTPRVSGEGETEDLIDHSPPTADELAEAERIARELGDNS